MYYTTQYSSPIGTLEIVGNGESIVGLWIEEQKYFQETIKNEELKEKDLPIFSETKKWLDQYFAKKQPSIKDLPLAPKGSEFQKKVWKILTEIPFGQTMTYGDIAKQIAAMEKKTCRHKRSEEPSDTIPSRLLFPVTALSVRMEI